MRRRSFIKSVGVAAAVPTLPIPELSEEEQEETLYRVQLHRADANDEVVIVSEPSERKALFVATDWAAREREMELGDPDVLASIHSEVDESTFGVLRGFGHLYASSRRVYRYVDRGESHVLG